MESNSALSTLPSLADDLRGSHHRRPALEITRPYPVRQDPTEPMWLILAGVRYGPYPHTFAEGLRHCYTIKGNFADAIIVPTDEPRSPHWVVSAGRRYIQHGSSMITGTPPEEKE